MLKDGNPIEQTRGTAVARAMFAVVVWGASFIATKMALAEVSPVTVVWLRFAMGVVVLGGLAAARGQLVRPSWPDLAYFMGLGILGIAFHQWLQSNGLVTSQASTSSWIVASTPIFMAVLGWLVLRERLGWVGTAGIAVAALGVLEVVSRGDLRSVAAGRFGAPGDFLILLSSPVWAAFSVLSRRGLRRFPAAGMTFWVIAMGWVFTTVLFLLGPGTAEVTHLTLRGWGAVAFLGIGCSGFAYAFWYDALAVLPASQAGALLYFEPLVTVAVAAAVLGEPVTAATLAGGGAILLGVWLVSRRPVAERP
ncbi:MAG TPA: DMT family transporter [Thermoanaerobaculia bacterium]|nr:DMT family transporter [Thermoanaerobaculia bacterium]